MKPKKLERKVWPLGSLYYLGSIEKAPDGPPEELPKKLVKATKARLAGDKSAELPSLNELKVLALDLLGYYSKRRLRMPAHMTMLLGLLMGLSEAHVENPDELLAGRGAGRPSNSSAARDIAFFVDIYHLGGAANAFRHQPLHDGGVGRGEARRVCKAVRRYPAKLSEDAGNPIAVGLLHLPGAGSFHSASVEE